MDITHRSGPDAGHAFHRMHRRLGEGTFGLHSLYFNTNIRRLKKKTLLRSPYVEIRHVVITLGTIKEWGAQIARRSSAGSEELMKLVLRPEDPIFDLIWRVANEECLSSFDTYRNHYGTEPESLTDLHLSVEYLRLGFDHQSPTRALGQFAKRKLAVPHEIWRYETEAAFALIEGIAISRAHPGFIAKSDRESSTNLDGGLVAYTANLDKTYKVARLWASMHRPDLVGLLT